MRIIRAIRDAALVLCMVWAMFVVSIGISYLVMLWTSSVVIGILAGISTALFISLTLLSYLNND